MELAHRHKHGVEPTLSAAEREQVKRRFASEQDPAAELRLHLRVSRRPTRPCGARTSKRRKRWIDLAHDTGAWGVKVRPNGSARRSAAGDHDRPASASACANSANTAPDEASRSGWRSTGAETQNPPVSAAIMKAAKHDNVGVCWNSNPTDIVNGSVKPSFDLLRPWIKNVHINELAERLSLARAVPLLRQIAIRAVHAVRSAGEQRARAVSSLVPRALAELNRA